MSSASDSFAIPDIPFAAPITPVVVMVPSAAAPATVPVVAAIAPAAEPITGTLLAAAATVPTALPTAPIELMAALPTAVFATAAQTVVAAPVAAVLTVPNREPMAARIVDKIGIKTPPLNFGRFTFGNTVTGGYKTTRLGLVEY